MERTIDGTNTLDETQSAINLTESHGHKLVLIAMDKSSDDPVNLATFEDTDEEVETQLVTVPPGVPAGEKKVCSATIFISGKKKRIAAYV